MVQLTDHSPGALLAAGVLAVLGVARATRLALYDAWPPVKWVRDRFLGWTDRGSDWRAGWAPLATCPFCAAPWFALVSLGWAWWSGLEGPWGVAWVAFHLWFSVSYLAAMVLVRDEPPEV